MTIRECLKQIDKDTCNQYDLTTLYESIELGPEDKSKLVKKLVDKEDPEVIYDFLYRMSDSSVCPICGKLLNDEGTCPVCDEGEEDYEESLEEAFYSTSLEDTPLVSEISFKNSRSGMLPGISPMNKFIDALNAVGKDRFKVRTSRFGSNLSEADLKDEWMELNRRGWKISRVVDTSLPGFNEVYLCIKRAPQKDNECFLKEDAASGPYTTEDLNKLEKELWQDLKAEDLSPDYLYIYPTGQAVITYKVQVGVRGDWKHDHLATKDMVRRFIQSNMPEVEVFNFYFQGNEEADSDFYESEYTWVLVPKVLEESMNEDAHDFPSYSEKAINQVIDKFRVNGPKYRGAKSPAFVETAVNESEYPDNMRAKSYDLVESEPNVIDLYYVTQEPFDDADFKIFLKEVRRAFSALDKMYNLKGDVVVNVEAKARDGENYGYGTESFTIEKTL